MPRLRNDVLPDDVSARHNRTGVTRLPSGALPAQDLDARGMEFWPGTVLLEALDRALPPAGMPYDMVAACAAHGLAAAVALDALLTRNRLGWADVLTPGHRLAKICGLLGSDYPAEHEAAYTHSLRLILLSRSTWSTLVRLPPDLDSGLDPRPAIKDPALLPDDAGPSPPAPEADWLTTIRSLKARTAWRSTEERLLLYELDDGLTAGEPISPPDARRLRDMWWCAELNDPIAEETAA